MRSRRRIRPLTLEQLAEVVRGEFAALPGLRLTESQVGRLLDLDLAGSRTVLGRLVDRHYLKINGTGQYSRADIGRSDTGSTGTF